MSSRKDKHRTLPLILILFGFGMFFGALIANKDFRVSIITKVKYSTPVTYVNKYFIEHKNDLAFYLPAKMLHRHQNR